MPDPLKTAELEDVLSSIRRLVTEQAEARASGASRLVLTPSLRIDGATAPELAQAVLPEPHWPGPEISPDPDDAAQRAWAASAQEAEARAEAEESAERNDISDATGKIAAPADSAADAAEAPAGEPSLEERLAELEAAISDPPAGTDWAFASTQGRPTRLHIRPPDDPSYEDDMPQPVWAAAPRFAARPEPGPVRAAPDEVDDTDEDLFAGLEDAVLDEEALRALVSEIVREELQGALGERITRNVRKLVRREINRVLASRDFG